MKLAEKPNVVQSNMQGEKIAMGIAVEDMAHAMGIFTNMYQNRLAAVIREYSSNAMDAQIEAGVTRPIEVTLPTGLSSFIKIRDYGVGLDVEDIRKIYSQYGRSTKRNTNDQVGMLGIGSKSALSYTSQFTVTSVREGIKIVVLVALEDDGSPTMQLLGQPVSVDDPDGTEVTVSIRREDISRTAYEAGEFFKFWAPGTVLVNGKTPERFDGLKVSDNLWITQGGPTDDRVVMGNVAYPQQIPLKANRDHYNARFALVAYVPIGSVKPAPSRESLIDTALTKATVNGICADFEKEIAGVVQREIDNAADHAAAVKVASDWSKYVPKNGTSPAYAYKGTPFPPAFKSPDKRVEYADRQGNKLTRYDKTPIKVTDVQAGYGMSAVSNWWEVPLNMWSTSLWVENFTPAKLSPTPKHKMIKYVKDQEIPRITKFILLEGKAPTGPFINFDNVVDYATIKAVKLPQHTKGPSGHISGSFRINTEDGTKTNVLGQNLRRSLPIFWYHGTYSSSYAAVLKMKHPKFTIVELPGNRISKFCREVPEAIKVKTACQAIYDEWQASIPEDISLAIKVKETFNYNLYSKLNQGKLAEKIKDPELRKAVEVYGLDTTAYTNKQRMFKYAVSTGRDKWKDPMKRYPLANYDAVADSIVYINAKYELDTAAFRS